MSSSEYATYFVSYKRYEDEPISTNLVHACRPEDVVREFDSCAWYFYRRAKDYEVKEARGKGMPERRL